MSTIVLVHGAGTGGWLWDGVAPLLAQRGHQVLAPTLSGIGERLAEGGPDTTLSTHVDELADLLPAVLVGFSYGGAVIAGVADKCPDRVEHLVFLDAFLPVPGRSMFDLMPEPVVAAMRAAAEDGWRMPPVPLERLGDIGDSEAGVDRDAVLAVLGARRGPHPIGTYAEVAAAPNPAAAAIPRTFVSCTQKRPGDPTLIMAGVARNAGWTILELPTGHFAMLTMPARLAELLDELSA